MGDEVPGDITSWAPPASHEAELNESSDRLMRRNKKKDRSCIVCHRRKVRCDKRSPCANCTRAGVLCCYPSDDDVLTRQPKTTIADIASRLVQLERTIIAVSGDSIHRETTGKIDCPKHSSPLGEVTSGDLATRQQSSSGVSVDEVLIHGGESSHYINEILLSRVLKEACFPDLTLAQEQEIQSAVARGDIVDNGPWDTQANSPRYGLLGKIHGLDSGEPTLPTMSQATELWQAFLKSANLCTRVLHIPTAQVMVYKSISSSEVESPSVSSLLYSIYFAAVTSLSPESVLRLLGSDKISALNRFRLGLEISLTRSDFLEHPNLLTLQALTVYLKTCRAHYTGRSMWIVSGIAVRAAQSIGLHRDGTNFNLSPFETEIRRRVWWYLMSQDWRAAEDHGITVTEMDLTSDTRVPLHVNDSELDSSMTELPIPQTRWTDMTFAITTIEVTFASRQIYQALLVSKLANVPPRESTRKEIIDRLVARVEGLLSFCNPVVPFERTTILGARICARKLAFVSRQQFLTAASEDTASEHLVHATDENLADACEILELQRALHADEQLSNFRWLGESYVQYHVALYLLWHLCVKPTSAGSDRAWNAINSAFDVETERIRRQGSASGVKWTTLKALREKACRIRGSIAQISTTKAIPSAQSITKPALAAAAHLENVAMAGAGEEEPGSGFEHGIASDSIPWDNEGIMDWNSFLDGINTKEFDFATF